MDLLMDRYKKEKAFEKFVAEENQKEQKEVDELVSYRYGAEKFE